MRQHIFRKTSLERLSSPEQLDQLMQITTPKGWFSLIALSSLLFVTILWGIFGMIPTKVNGQGILIKKGGILNIVSMSSGQISDIAVVVGDLVDKGQTVARISQPSIVDQLRSERARLQDLQSQETSILSTSAKSVQKSYEVLDQQKANLTNSIEIAEKNIKSLQEKIQGQTRLLTKGLITKQQLENTKQEFFATQQQIEQQKNQINEIEVQKLKLGGSKEQERRNLVIQMNEVKRTVEILEDRLVLNSRVVSPHRGRIIEIRADEGSIVGTGAPILSLERISKEEALTAVIYVPPTEGKKVRMGMNVGISPSTIKREEFGVMKGKVTYVSKFPSTSEGMMNVIKNHELVQSLSRGGAPIEVHVDLLPDETTSSGYQWTSSKGPSTKIFSGTISTASIVVSEQRPIGLVIPYLKSVVGF
ncbi:NHLP bacteriocin system secretion protein [Deltaproteobacteria bacterium TL4]